MSFNLDLPRITAATDAEQLVQVKSYMYRLVEQLNWALNSIEVSSAVITTNQGTDKPVASQTQQSVDNFNAIKSLIIKSADIINAYYDEISHRLEGIYIAQSDFGTFVEETQSLIEANSTSITQIYSDLQKVISDVAATLKTNAYIKTGILYYGDDGFPVYGLELGQTNEVDGVNTFDKYARFTADKLSFYDQNENEVAYISDQKLYITEAHITGALTLGRYYISTVNGLAFKWIS